MAVQGYFMTCMHRPYELLCLQGEIVQSFQSQAKRLGVVVFLGCAERDAADGKAYNSCLAIGCDGSLLGCHRKIKTVRWKTEAWSSPGRELQPICVDGVRTGVLVCADAWFGEHAEILASWGAQVIVVAAAWPKGCGGPPEDAWRRCSARGGGVPVLLCNQTGKSGGMDCTLAKSAVVTNGILRASYCGAEAILLADIDLTTGTLRSETFDAVKWEEIE